MKSLNLEGFISKMGKFENGRKLGGKLLAVRPDKYKGFLVTEKVLLPQNYANSLSLTHFQIKISLNKLPPSPQFFQFLVDEFSSKSLRTFVFYACLNYLLLKSWHFFSSSFVIF